MRYWRNIQYGPDRALTAIKYSGFHCSILYNPLVKSKFPIRSQSKLLFLLIFYFNKLSDARPVLKHICFLYKVIASQARD